MEKLFNKNRKIYWKHIWNQQQQCDQIEVQEKEREEENRNRTTENRPVFRHQSHTHTHKQPGRQATNRWSRSEKTPSSFLPPVESKQQNRADVDKKWKCSFSVSERDRKWEWKVLAKITPSHKHTHTHTERENKNHPRLTTFNLPVDWCKISNSDPRHRNLPPCVLAHVKLSCFFSSFFRPFRLCYSLLFCSYAYCHHHHRQETGRKLFRFGCLCCHEICSVEKNSGTCFGISCLPG